MDGFRKGTLRSLFGILGSWCLVFGVWFFGVWFLVPGSCSSSNLLISKHQGQSTSHQVLISTRRLRALAQGQDFLISQNPVRLLGNVENSLDQFGVSRIASMF